MDRQTREAFQFAALVLSVFLGPFLLAFATLRLLPVLESAFPAWFLRQVCTGFLCLFTVIWIPILLALGVLWMYARIYEAGYVPNEW